MTALVLRAHSYEMWLLGKDIVMKGSYDHPSYDLGKDIVMKAQVMFLCCARCVPLTKQESVG